MHYAEHPGFNPGGIPSPHDSRDFQFAEIGMALPPFDWTKGADIEIDFTLPVEDQNGSGSCGGQAWRYQAEVHQFIFTKLFERKSAKFIYAQTFVPPSGGSTGRDNANVYVNQGVSSEDSCPSYENGLPPSEAFMTKQDITDKARVSAKKDMALAYANVSTDIESVAQSLLANHGTIIGVSGQNNGTWTSPFPKPPTVREWGHWLFCGKAKLINGVKHIGVLNSWGTSVGEAGWQWLAEDYFTAIIPSGHAVFEAWTHTFNPKPPTQLTHTFLVDLKFGAKGAEVMNLQSALHLTGDLPLGIPNTGNYLENTRLAVLKFQLRNRLDNGALQGKIVGPKTRAALNLIFA